MTEHTHIHTYINTSIKQLSTKNNRRILGWGEVVTTLVPCLIFSCLSVVMVSL